MNLPPDLYRDLRLWVADAAVTLDDPRVDVQETLRAAIRVLTDPSAGTTAKRVLAALGAGLGAR